MGFLQTKAARWIAVAAVLGLAVAGAFFALRGAAPSTDDAALMRAFERETGLVLSVRGSQLSAASGTWRAEHVELRAAAGAEPVLVARAATLHLDVGELLRGRTRIERAVIEGAELTIDLRAQSPAGSVARAIDMARLHSRLPAHIAANGLRLHVHTEGAGNFDLEGVDLTLDQQTAGMTGRLRSQPSGAVLTSERTRDTQPAISFALESAVSWDPTHVELKDARIGFGASALIGHARFQSMSAAAPSYDLMVSGADVEVAALPLAAFMTSSPSPSSSQTLAGKGRVVLHVSPSDVSLELDLHDASVQQKPLERLRAKLTNGDSGLVARDVYVERGAERWTAETLALGTLDALRPIGSARVESLDLQRALGLPGRASGVLQLAAKGEKNLSVRAQLELSEVEIAGHRFDQGQLTCSFVWSEQSITARSIDSLELSSKGATLAARGKLSDAGALELTAKGAAVWQGLELVGEGAVLGTVAAPEVTAHVTPKRAREKAHADVVLVLAGEPSITGTVELREIDLSASLPKLEHAGAAHGRLSARLQIKSGRLDDLSSIEGTGEVSALALGYGALSLSSAAFPIALRKGRIELSGVTLADESSRWALHGSIGLDRALDLEASAELPLGPLLVSAPYVGAVEGKLAVALKLAGTLDSIKLTGRADPRAVEMALGPEQTPWRKLDGHVTLEGGALRFHEIAGAFGTGTLTLNGTLTLAGFSASAVDLSLAARHLSFEPQERFQFELDADTALRWSRSEQAARGEQALPKLSGRVKLTRLLYARHVQLPEAVLAIGRVAPSSRAPTLALDLSLEHAVPLLVRNDFLDVELGVSGDEPFRIVGTDTKLGARGELSVIRGRALFRGAVLTVRHGRIGFESDTRITPSLDLQADAPAKRRPGALIMFKAAGDPNRFALELRCATKDGAGSPPPFECKYDGSEMSCGRFEQLTALWACERP